MTCRNFFSHSLHHSHWLLPLDFLLPARASWVVNVVFYAYLFWLCVIFFRLSLGKERVLVAGWFLLILLSPIQDLVSIPAAAAIEYAKAISISVAFVAALLLLLERSAGDKPSPDRNPPG